MRSVGLMLATVGAILAWTRGGFFAHQFTDPKLVLIILGVVIAGHGRGWRKSPFFLPAAAYVLCMVPSLIQTIDLRMSFFGYPGIYSGSIMTTVLCAAGFFLAEQSGDPRVKTGIMCAGTLTAALCLIQAGRADPFRLGIIQTKAVGFVGSHVDAGALFAVLMAFAPTRFMPGYLAGLWATSSRGAWLGAAVSLTPKRWRIAAFAVITALGLGWVYLAPSVSQSDLGRQALWRVAARHLSWFGTGPATFDHTFRANWGEEAAFAKTEPTFRQVHTHNAILEAASTRGFFGILGLLALLVLPELAGLWTICMFNPVSFEIVFVACVLAGLRRSPNWPKGEPT